MLIVAAVAFVISIPTAIVAFTLPNPAPLAETSTFGKIISQGLTMVVGALVFGATAFWGSLVAFTLNERDLSEPTAMDLLQIVVMYFEFPLFVTVFVIALRTWTTLVWSLYQSGKAERLSAIPESLLRGRSSSAVKAAKSVWLIMTAPLIGPTAAAIAFVGFCVTLILNTPWTTLV